MRDLGLLVLRVTTGGLLAGHGAQKLFGKFGGHGIQGTAGWLESLGMKPGKPWAYLAGASEFGGGVLTALGLFHPIGPLTTLAPMAMATGTAHRGKPIWVTAGGAELPVTNMAAGAALTLAGPGRYSLDRALGIKLPLALGLLTAAGVAGGIAYGLMRSRSETAAQPAQGETPDEEARAEDVAAITDTEAEAAVTAAARDEGVRQPATSR